MEHYTQPKMNTFTLGLWSTATGEILKEFHNISWSEVVKYMHMVRTLNILGDIHVEIRDSNA